MISTREGLVKEDCTNGGWDGCTVTVGIDGNWVDGNWVDGNWVDGNWVDGNWVDGG